MVRFVVFALAVVAAGALMERAVWLPERIAVRLVAGEFGVEYGALARVMGVE